MEGMKPLASPFPLLLSVMSGLLEAQSTFGTLVGSIRGPETRQILRVDVQMIVGQMAGTVNVEARAAPVETQTGVTTDARTGPQMRELPLH
jgi:hypothetical protein